MEKNCGFVLRKKAADFFSGTWTGAVRGGGVGRWGRRGQRVGGGREANEARSLICISSARIRKRSAVSN